MEVLTTAVRWNGRPFPLEWVRVLWLPKDAGGMVGRLLAGVGVVRLLLGSFG